MLLAAAIHGALTFGEQRLREDRVYAATFQPEHEKRVEAELRRFQAEKPRTGEQVAVQRQQLESRYRVFPLKTVLGVAMGIAAVVGVAIGVRSRKGDCGGVEDVGR